MYKKIEKLLSISSTAFSQEQVNLAPDLLLGAGKLGRELNEILNTKNGFYAFESALRIFSTVETEYSHDISTWNSQGLWRNEYPDLINDCLFFAEDIFGGQFCIKNNLIYTFDPETGELEEIANSLEKWADRVLSDYNVLTGYPLAHQWQKKYGVLAHTNRLMPKIPFICGGEYEVDNLLSIDAISGMKSRGNLAKQIAYLPDGANIEFNIID